MDVNYNTNEVNIKCGFSGESLNYDGEYILKIYLPKQEHDDLTQIPYESAEAIVLNMVKEGKYRMSDQDPYKYRKASENMFFIQLRENRPVGGENAIWVSDSIDQYLELIRDKKIYGSV